KRCLIGSLSEPIGHSDDHASKEAFLLIPTYGVMHLHVINRIKHAIRRVHHYGASSTTTPKLVCLVSRHANSLQPPGIPSTLERLIQCPKLLLRGFPKSSGVPRPLLTWTQGP